MHNIAGLVGIGLMVDRSDDHKYGVSTILTHMDRYVLFVIFIILLYSFCFCSFLCHPPSQTTPTILTILESVYVWHYD